MAFLDAKDIKLMEGWLQRREKVTELDYEYKPRWVVFTKKRWLIFESPYAIEQALTSYSIPAISSLEYSRQVKEFSFSTPQSGRVDFRSDSSKTRDKWVFLLRDTIPQAKLEQTQEMMQRKAESQAAREFAEIQRSAAFNTILQAENLIMCMDGYRAYAMNLAQTLTQVIYFADVVLREGMNAAKPLSETIMELVDRANSSIAIGRDPSTRAGLVMHSVRTCRQAAEVLTYAKTAAQNEGDLRDFIEATAHLKRVVHEFLDFLDRTSTLSDLDDSLQATSSVMGKWMDGLIRHQTKSINHNNEEKFAKIEEMDAPLPSTFQLYSNHQQQQEQQAMPSVEEIATQGSALYAELSGLSALLSSCSLSAGASADGSAALNESALRVAFLLRALVENARVVCDLTPAVNGEARDGNMLDCALRLAGLVEALLSNAAPGRPLDPQQLQELSQLLASMARAADLAPEARRAVALAHAVLKTAGGNAEKQSSNGPDWLAECPAPPPPPVPSSSSSSSPGDDPAASSPYRPPLPPRANQANASSANASSANDQNEKAKTPAAALQQVTARVEQAALALANIKSAQTVMQEQALTYAEVSALRLQQQQQSQQSSQQSPSSQQSHSSQQQQQSHVLIVDLPPQLLEDARGLAVHAAELLRAATEAYKEARRLQKEGGGDELGGHNPKFLVFAARLVTPAVKKLLRVAQQDEPEAVVAAARLLNYSLAQLAASARAKLPASNAACARLAAATSAVQGATKAIATTSLQPKPSYIQHAGGAGGGEEDMEKARSALVQGLEAQQAMHALDTRLQGLRGQLAAVRQSPDAKSTKLSGRAKALEREYELQLQLARIETEMSRLNP